MAAVPRPLRTPQSSRRHLRARVRHPLPPRARLHPLPHALARPRPETAPHRNPRQPHRPHHRSRARRMARRGRGPEDQPGRSRGQAHPGPSAIQHHRGPRHTLRPHAIKQPETDDKNNPPSSENRTRSARRSRRVRPGATPTAPAWRAAGRREQRSAARPVRGTCELPVGAGCLRWGGGYSGVRPDHWPALLCNGTGTKAIRRARTRRCLCRRVQDCPVKNALAEQTMQDCICSQAS